MIWFPKSSIFWLTWFEPVGRGLTYSKNYQTLDERAIWDLNLYFPKFQKDLKMKRAKVSGPKIGTVRSKNAIFSLEAELYPKWLLWSISPLIRPLLNKILTDNLVTCPNMGNYFAFFQSILQNPIVHGGRQLSSGMRSYSLQIPDLF